VNTPARDANLSARTGRLGRTALVVGVAALGTCVLAGLARPDQFFRSYLLAFVFWNGLTIGAMAVLMLQYLTGGAWGIAIRRELEAAMRTLPLMALAFLPLIAGMRRLYVWSRPDVVASDELLHKKALYLNPPFFVARTVVCFAAWLAIAYFLSRWSLAQDSRPDRELNRKLLLLSGGGLVVYALTTTIISVDWVMSLEPHWYSTMYGVLYMVGQGLAALAFASVAVVLLSDTEPLSGFIGDRHRHDLGKMMFAFTMLWAYVSYSQYLIVWSGNLPEEIAWYLARFRGGWGWVAGAILVFQFVLPFLLLLSRRANENPRTLAATAALIVGMRFVDVAWLVLPAFSRGVFRLHWMDLAAPIGLGGLWLAFFARNLADRPLLPVGDPGFEEALAHGHE
jgi:hypothetical protein